MINIKKGKFIRLCLSIFASIIFTGLTTLCYLLGWTFDISTFIIYICILIIEILLIWCIYYTCNLVINEVYRIDHNNIQLLKKGININITTNKDIKAISYIKFRWALVFQMGAGYLTIECSTNPDNTLNSISFPNKKNLFLIDMSLKQAKEVGKLLEIDLKIK